MQAIDLDIIVSRILLDMMDSGQIHLPPLDEDLLLFKDAAIIGCRRAEERLSTSPTKESITNRITELNSRLDSTADSLSVVEWMAEIKMYQQS